MSIYNPCCVSGRAGLCRFGDRYVGVQTGCRTAGLAQALDPANKIMFSLAQRLQAVNERIADAAAAAGRRSEDIQLVAVSKTFATTFVCEAYAAGQRRFGENYVQEGVRKVIGLTPLPLEWHFIGPVQGNKTRLLAEHFDWVHSVDRYKIAQRLSAARPANREPLQICLQVNIGNEEQKGGVSPSEILILAEQIMALPKLMLRGLMTIPEPTLDSAFQYRRFRELRELKEQMNKAGIPLDTLSMGMSVDLEAAITEGATMVRVGRAIFGDRPG